ncbi:MULTISPECIES: PIG-L deacetylase family protein [unclassified Pseudonocardia]|uniref:PIG-L deacetylase family protein n=1 Tax=unclassified Pseudonocardia TaxID=2619320 RepID=UPI00076180D2|nr:MULTISPECIES: PIG-L deacetylase family protein [unclassified Pseudonocardia]OLM18672.1 N-acetyl-1-D-myo-inosityl-2-amino-2-deoxy-alpha- D-glucopyranoside deacetylase MshB [Pseudonocardia sp. Ae707_Ps1]
MPLHHPAPLNGAHTPDLSGETVVALHAHPDDESIFTGLTLRRLADAGARIVLVMATGGDLGGSRLPLADGETVTARRRRELEDAAALLGVSRLVLLGHRDSGLPGGPGTAHPHALAGADPVVLGRTVAELVDAEGAGTVVHDDDAGIYGHPDHRAAHAAGAVAVALTGATGYRMTVDREHLAVSARDGHLVHGAARAAGVPFGRVTAEIAVAVAGTAAELAVKRDAMLAHASQIDPAGVPGDGFAAAYGYEWFLRGERDGAPAAPGVLDALGNAHLLAGAR